MEKQRFEERYRAILLENGLERFTGTRETDLFERFFMIFFAENAKTNLSAIRTATEGIAKHLADCLLAADLFPRNATVLDLGCGGGFPTFPLAVARPDLKITAMDSTRKKIDFVAKTAETLGLSNIQAICGRAEDAKWRGLRETFDAVTGRAVANLRVFTELALPFVCVGGALISYKGAQGSAELREAERAIQTLGGAVAEDRACELHCPVLPETNEKTPQAATAGEEDGEKNAQPLVFSAESRHLLVIRKEKHTPPQYPRAYAAILKNPL